METIPTTEFILDSDNSAWELLEKILQEGAPEGLLDIRFDGWPRLVFSLKGDKFNSSLTIKTMNYFVELQRNINCAYAQLKYNRPNSIGLSNAERDGLEIIVKVDKGSSLFEVNFQQAFESLLKGIVGKMSGTEMMYTILGVGLIYGTVTVLKHYLDQQGKDKQIEMLQALSAQETEKMKLIAETAKRQPQLIPIYSDAEDTYNDLIRSSTEADYLELDKYRLQRDVAEQMIRQKREKSAEVQLNGHYRILSVDSSKTEGFVVGLRSVDDGREFHAVLEDKFVFRRDANLELIKDAEWGKTDIHLHINGKELRGTIQHATIIEVIKGSTM